MGTACVGAGLADARRSDPIHRNRQRSIVLSTHGGTMRQYWWNVAWTLGLGLGFLPSASSDVAAQLRYRPDGAVWDGGQHSALSLIIHDRPKGQQIAALVGGSVVAGLIVLDIASTPRSVREFNERYADESPRSPRKAVVMSVAATVVPIAVGATVMHFAFQEGTPAGAELGGAGLVLFGSGIVLGPSLGHFYARRFDRGLSSAGLRAVLSFLTAFLTFANVST